MILRSSVLVCLWLGLVLSALADEADSAEPPLLDAVFRGETLQEAVSDGDGVPDDEDAFPDDPTETVDTDGDGIGDNADPDDDNDGMPDSFETATGFDPLDPADADADADGDGFTNLEEFEAETDPHDPESKPSRDLSWLFLLLLDE